MRESNSPAEVQAPLSLHRSLQRLGELQDLELGESRGQIAQAKALLRGAIGELYASFQSLGTDTREYHEQAKMLVSSREERQGQISVQSVVGDASRLLTEMSRFQEQSVEVARLIDYMVSQMDAIFGLVKRIDEIAEETNILAINATLEAAHAGAAGHGMQVVANEVRSLSKNTKALNASIAEKVEGTQGTIDSVRGAMEAMSFIGHTQNIEEMLGQFNRMNDRLQDTISRMGEFTTRVEQNANVAVRSLQFEDILTQLLDHLDRRLSRLEGSVSSILSEDPREDLMTPQEDHCPVQQQDMDAGSIELF